MARPPISHTIIDFDTFYMNKLRALILTVVFAVCCYEIAVAYKNVLFVGHDGTSFAVAIKEDLKITLDDENINATCSTYTFSVPVVDCDKWLFVDEVAEDKPSGVKDVEADNVSLRRCQNHLVVSGLADGETVSLATINGRLISSGKAVAGSDFVISLVDISPGIYVAACGNRSVKFVVR